MKSDRIEQLDLLHNQKAAEGTEKNPDATALNTLDPRLAPGQEGGSERT